MDKSRLAVVEVGSYCRVLHVVASGNEIDRERDGRIILMHTEGNGMTMRQTGSRRGQESRPLHSSGIL